MADQQQQHQAANFQDTLTLHDRLKRSIDLPLFHADESKDTITVPWLIGQVKITANIATWDNK